jgi:hypothetical protein
MNAAMFQPGIVQMGNVMQVSLFNSPFTSVTVMRHHRWAAESSKNHVAFTKMRNYPFYLWALCVICDSDGHEK